MYFTIKKKKGIFIHVRMDSMVALSYLMEMEAQNTRNQSLSANKFRITFWINGDYLPGVFNVEAEMEYIYLKDSGK